MQARLGLRVGLGGCVTHMMDLYSLMTSNHLFKYVSKHLIQFNFFFARDYYGSLADGLNAKEGLMIAVGALSPLQLLLRTLISKRKPKFFRKSKFMEERQRGRWMDVAFVGERGKLGFGS